MTAMEVTRDLNWGNYSIIHGSYILRMVVHVRKKGSQVHGCHDQNMIRMYIKNMMKAGQGTESESYMCNEYYESGPMSHGNDKGRLHRNMIRIEKCPLGI